MQPEEQKDTSRNEQTPPAYVLPPEGGSKRDKKKWFILIVLLLLLLGLILGGLWWMGKDDAPKANNDKSATSKTEDAKKPASASSACEEGFTRYNNEALDISFCYPTPWGDVSQHDAKFAPADTGSRWRLSFSAMPQVTVGLASADWTTEVPRDGVCVDPAVTELPAFDPFQTDWTTTLDSPVSSGSRGIAKADGDYVIRENVDSLLTNGVCVEAYKVLDESEHYAHAAASYSAEFNGVITNPEQHIATPNVLVPATDRVVFKIFVESMRGVL